MANKKDLVGIVSLSLLAAAWIITYHIITANQNKEMAAYEEALKNHKPVHRILIGDEGVNTVSQVTEKMSPIYADVNGKKIKVPFEMRQKYIAEINGIKTSGKDGWRVYPKQELRY